jgi:glutamate--cysteine ligase
LRLTRGAEEVTLVAWSREVLAECAPIADALDAASGTDHYGRALAKALFALDNPASTPSARVLDAMARDHGNSYERFVRAQSDAHREAILALPFPDALAQRFARLAEASWAKQAAIEAGDTMPFEIYRQKYLDPARLKV